MAANSPAQVAAECADGSPVSKSDVETACIDENQDVDSGSGKNGATATILNEKTANEDEFNNQKPDEAGDAVAPVLPFTGPPKEKRKRRRNSKAARAMLGVGKLLEQYKQLHTDNGNFDVDEDDQGRYNIGGMELSFESWGQLTRPEEAGVVRADYVPPAQPKKRRAVSPIEWRHVSKNASTSRTTHNEKLKKRKSSQDRDEGELSDTDQSDDSISSESEDEGHQRYRRQRKVKEVQKQPPAMNLQKLFTTAFKYRDAVVQSFTVHEKMQFLDAIRAGAHR